MTAASIYGRQLHQRVSEVTLSSAKIRTLPCLTCIANSLHIAAERAENPVHYEVTHKSECSELESKRLESLRRVEVLQYWHHAHEQVQYLGLHSAI